MYEVPGTWHTLPGSRLHPGCNFVSSDDSTSMSTRGITEGPVMEYIAQMPETPE